VGDFVTRLSVFVTFLNAIFVDAVALRTAFAGELITVSTAMTDVGLVKGGLFGAFPRGLCPASATRDECGFLTGVTTSSYIALTVRDDHELER